MAYSGKMIVTQRGVRRVCGAMAVAAAFAGLAPASPAIVHPAVAAARAYWAEHGSAVVGELADLLRLPNTAAHPEGLEATAVWLRDALARRGAEAELLRVPGAPPAVWGRLEAPGATRTVGLYLHYDGQPVDPAQWTFPPWEPTLLTRLPEDGGRPRPLPAAGEAVDPEWRLFARSASDDKAPAAAVLAALDALERFGVARDVHLVFLFEGEEESGSPHLGELLRSYRERLAADLWLIADGPLHPSRRPQLVFGVRGYAGLELTVYGARRPLHSGHYGNWAPNPALALAHLLAGLKDETGRVAVAGFYDEVDPAAVRADAAAAAATTPPFEEALREDLGFAATEAGGEPYLERILLPALNVRGLASGAVGAAAANAIPASASASLDLRLVEGEDPERMLGRIEDHLRREGWHLVRGEPTETDRRSFGKIVRVEREPGYPGVRTRLDDPAARWAIGRARTAAGQDLILTPTLGGSLPLFVFRTELGAPIVIVPLVNHDNNQHAPDENLRLGNLAYGVELMAALFAGA